MIPSNVPGEGEIKIFNMLNIFSKPNRHYTHLVVGNDADLIVIAMATRTTNNIDIMIHLQSEHYIISIKKLCELYATKIHNNKLAYFNENIKSDFCVLSILNGNDYLPKLYYTTFDSLWKAYFATKRINNNTTLLNDNGEFNIQFLKDMMFIINQNIAKQFKTFSLSKFNPPKIKKYLEGLLWCLYMYTIGICPDYSYIYEYNKGVSPIDIHYYLILYNIHRIDIPISIIPPLSTNSCMVLLLPKIMKNLLPKQLIGLADKFYEIGLYEEEECIICNNLKDGITSKKKEYINNKNDIIKKEIASLGGKLLHHRESHNNISLDIINKVIKIVDN